jgi:hypothetical protein
MGTTFSPSDFTEINPDYSQGRGFYTNATEVANLLQVPAFSVSTFPTLAQVGAIIKRVEGIVDDKIKRSFRPIVTKDEYHNFEFSRPPHRSYYGGHVGFIQLKQMKVRKIVSLLVWQGTQYVEIASAQAKIELLDNFRDLHSIILQLPNNGVSFTLLAENDITQLGNDEFSNTFGIKTTNNDITALINSEFPSTSAFTGATAAKSLISNNLTISDFFYASKDKDNGKRILISSLLSGDDGSECSIKVSIQSNSTTASTNLLVVDSTTIGRLQVGMAVSGNAITAGSTITSINTSNNTITLSLNHSGASNEAIRTFTTATGQSIPTVCTITDFTDKEDLRRLGDYWTINEEGRIFFLKDYPYHMDNSVVVTYVAGDTRVPSAIHEATTKLSAAEILRNDDQSILIAETGANITTKEKYDILRKEGMDTLKGKADIVYFLD